MTMNEVPSLFVLHNLSTPVPANNTGSLCLQSMNVYPIQDVFMIFKSQIQMLVSLIIIVTKFHA